jgi:peptidase M20/M25/M40-like protein
MNDRVLAAFHAAEMLDLAKSLIKIPSTASGETECGRFLADYLGKHGFETQLMEVGPGRYQTIAWLQGKGQGSSLMFNGHIDIDPLVEGWSTDPWAPTSMDGRLYGAGVRNMKAGVAAMIEIVLMIQRAAMAAVTEPYGARTIITEHTGWMQVLRPRHRAFAAYGPEGRGGGRHRPDVPGGAGPQPGCRSRSRSRPRSCRSSGAT